MSPIETRAFLQDRLTQALDQIRAAGATGEVGLHQDQGLSVSVRHGEVDKVAFTRNHGIAVTLYRGRRRGHATSNDFSPDSVRQTVQAALDIAHYTAEDPCSGLADAAQMAADLPDLALYRPWELTPEQAIALARQCEAAGLSQPGISNSDGASVASGETLRGYGNTHGLLTLYPLSRHALGCTLLAEQDGRKERGGWSASQRHPERLPTPEAIGQQAAERAARRRGARPIATGRMPVLFAADIAGSLLGHAIAAISGGNLYRHASFLENSLHQRIFPEWMTLSEHPHLPGEIGSAPLDGDGLATAEKSFVQNGELVSYVLGTYSARKLGLRSTANAGGVRNVRCTTTHTHEELLQQMHTGLLVTELMGQGVNLITGDYSRGAAGFWVENGAIQFPVAEITLAGNLKNLFETLVGVGDDIDARGNIQCGSILLEQMTVGGK